MHKNHAHRNEWNQVKADLGTRRKFQDNGRSSKIRWTLEEDMVLAKLILSLQTEGTVKGKVSNEVLASTLHGRTAEAINCHRKTEAFKSFFAQIEPNHEAEHSCSESRFERQDDHPQSPSVTRSMIGDQQTHSTLPSHDGGETGSTLFHSQESGIRANLKEDMDGAVQEMVKKYRNKPEILRSVRSLAQTLELAIGNPEVETILNSWLDALTAEDGTGSHQRRKTSVFVNRNGRLKGKNRTKAHENVLSMYRKQGVKGVANYLFRGMDDGETDTPGNNDTNVEEHVDSQVMLSYWKSIYENGRGELSVGNYRNTDPETNIIMSTISVEDIIKTTPKRKTAPGLDGIKAKRWRNVPVDIRALFYNIVLYHGVVLQRLAKARTIFLKKTVKPTAPNEFRPISITSVILRQLHKILARRLNDVRPSSDRQVAFKSVDGVAYNIATIRALVQHSKTNQQDLHIVSMDLRKAFDSVNTEAIIDIAKKKGLPVEFIEYLIKYYSNAETQLQLDDGTSCDVRISRGVFQGCPLSPILFNLVMDSALEHLDNRLGYQLNEENTRIECMAFADDVNIIGSSVAGVQLNINAFTNKLAMVGLRANPEKCYALSVRHDRKNKRAYLDTNDKFEVWSDDKRNVIKSIEPSGGWKYLGIKFTGETVDTKMPSMEKYLQCVDESLLHPQQKLEVLNKVLIPKWINITSFGNAGREELRTLDKRNRVYIRKWLHLPHDVPIVYLHAPVRCGGLGIFEFAIRIPFSRYNRLSRVRGNENVVSFIQKSQLFERCQNDFNRILNQYEVTADQDDLVARMYMKVLNEKLCTVGLSDSYESRISRAWLGSKVNEISPSDFIKYNLISSNSLPTQARRNWGRKGEQNVECRAGCKRSETTHHILQECVIAHGMRIKRHDRIVNFIAEDLSKKWVDTPSVEIEPHFQTSAGMRKPDLILHSTGYGALVIDVHIVGRYQTGLKNSVKANKYQSIEGFTELVKERYDVPSVSYHAITISYTGIIEKSSVKLLRDLGFSNNQLHMMATSVLRGSWYCWTIFLNSSNRRQ